MARTRITTGEIKYKRQGNKMVPVSKKVSKQRTKVIKPSRNAIIAGLKDDKAKVKALANKEKQETLRTLGTEAAASAAQAIGAIRDVNVASANTKNASNNVMNQVNQNINGGAITSGNNRDDDSENENEDSWSGVY